MSRSNPNQHLSNPATRWFEWNGEAGCLRYWDREKEKRVDVALPFTFLLIDELATVGGWHQVSDSRIFANEVRDTTTEVLVVKAFQHKTTLAEGKYRNIAETVKAAGGGYVANCYVAYTALVPGDPAKTTYALGSIKWKGAALGAWVDFRKLVKDARYTKAIRIEGFTEGKNGRVVFRVPSFVLAEVSAEADSAAKALDEDLQAYLDVYLRRNTHDQAVPVDAAAPPDETEPPPMTADQIPF